MIRHLPNLLTASRLILLFPLMALLSVPRPAAHRLAFALFVLAAVTDFLDGWTARRFHAESNIGIFFDPLVDKVFANVLLVYLGLRFPAWVPAPLLLSLLAREFVVQGFRSMAPCKGVVLRTRRLSKLKFVFQTLCIAAVLLGVGTNAAAPRELWRAIAQANLAAALFFGYLSMGLLLWRNHDLWRRPTVPMEQR